MRQSTCCGGSLEAPWCAGLAERTNVAPSAIPDSGLGLFCTHAVPRDTHIATVHTGVVLNSKAAFALDDKSYLIRLGADAFLDTNPRGSTPQTLCSRGTMANDPRVPLLYNTYTVKRPCEGRADIYTARNIEAGEELYADYGSRYWQAADTRPARLPPGLAGTRLCRLPMIDPEWHAAAVVTGCGNRGGGWVEVSPLMERLANCPCLPCTVLAG